MTLYWRNLDEICRRSLEFSKFSKSRDVIISPDSVSVSHHRHPWMITAPSSSSVTLIITALDFFQMQKINFHHLPFLINFFPYFQNGFQIWVCIFKLKFEFYFWKPDHCEEDCAVFQLVLIKLSKEIISIRMDIKCCLSCSCMEFIWLMKILHTSLKVVCLNQLCTL